MGSAWRCKLVLCTLNKMESIDLKNPVAFLLFAVMLCGANLRAQPSQCNPIPVAVFKPYDFDAEAAFNVEAGNFLVVWNRSVDVDRFTTSNSLYGRIVSGQGVTSTARGYSFGSGQGRMADQSFSAVYNPTTKEFFLIWFEIPENGLNHGSGLYFRRIDPSGTPIGGVGKVTSQYMFQPRVVYNPSQNDYLLGYGEGLDAVAIVRMSTAGQITTAPKTFSGPPKSFNSLETFVPVSDAASFVAFWNKTIFTSTGNRRNTLMVQRVAASGDLVGSSHPAVKNGVFGLGNPVAVYSPARREFLALIVGSERSSLIQEVQVVRLSQDLLAMELPHTIATADSRWPPALAYNPATGGFALFYARDDSLFFRELGPLAKPLGVEQLMSCTKRSRSNPGLLFDSSIQQFFSYWTHANRQTAYDVYATPIPWK